MDVQVPLDMDLTRSLKAVGFADDIRLSRDDIAMGRNPAGPR